MESNQEIEHFPIADAVDHAILMHRDAHFGGLFGVMLDYYAKEGKGTQPDFTIEKIEKLEQLEKEMKQNLAGLFLSAAEAQKVADVRDIYKQLRALYAFKNSESVLPQLIADLVLSESEDAEEEIQAIVAQKGASVPFLIDLLRNEQFYDPLFPGYGQAPVLAARCLGRIGDKRAIISLFEAIGQSDFFSDDIILDALKQIGEPAKVFLMKVAAGKPYNEDNEKAAIALLAFKDDPEVAEHCLQLLKEDLVVKDPCLSTYLLLGCEGLATEDSRQAFKALLPRLNATQKRDADIVIKSWDRAVQ